MKLNIGKRLVLLLHWVLSLIAAAMAVMYCVWPETIHGLLDQLNALIGLRKTQIIGIAALAVYVILAVLSALILFSGSGKKRQRGMITVDSSEAGKTRIAVGAVEQMIRQAVRGVDGITEMKSGIINHEDSISINTHVSVANGAHVPTVTMNIQRAIRSYIELNCGVAVREVGVNVHSVEGPSEAGRRMGRKIAAEPVHASPKQEPAYEPPKQETVYTAPKQEPVYELPKREPVYAAPEIRPQAYETPAAPVEEVPAPEEPVMNTETQEETDYFDEPISLTFDPPKEMVNENHPIDEQ